MSSPPSSEETAAAFVINVRMNSVRFSIASEAGLNASSTVRELKEAISRKDESDHCEVERQRLIFKGRILSDNGKTLGDYGISQSDEMIYLVKSTAPSSSSSNPSPAAAAATPAPTPAAAAASRAVPPAGAAPNPFAAMMGGPAMSPQQMMQNPEQMAEMMNSPLMQSLLNNPDFMSNLMQSNPQMRQLMESNPELRQVLQDPDVMRRSLEMMRNPNAMQQMMRNQDLAMSQIENLPGGFNALRRMYEEVQDPLMDAMTSGGSNDGAQGSSTAGSSSPSSDNTAADSNDRGNASAGAAGTAMPNPWGPPSSAVGTQGTGMGAAVPPFNPWGGFGGGAAANPLQGAMGADQLESTINMLESNPMLSQMMDQMLANPQAMEQLMASNPMFQQMRQSNPMMANMLSNPQTLRAMMNPSNLRAMANLQSSMQQLQQGGVLPPGPMMGGLTPDAMPNLGTAAAPVPTPPPGDGGLDFSALLSQFQGASVGGVAAAPTTPAAPVPPEERYRAQLQSLEGMGFDDRATNIRALQQSNGSLNGAVDLLLSGAVPAATESTSTPSTESTNTPSDSSNSAAEGGNAASNTEEKKD